MKQLSSKNDAFRYQKGKASDRKGMGMELALLVLLVVFACSTLLVSSAMLGKDALNTKEQDVLQKMALDEFAERMLAGESAEEIRQLPKFANYEVVTDAEGRVTVRTDGSALTYRLAEDHTIIEWVYH